MILRKRVLLYGLVWLSVFIVDQWVKQLVTKKFPMEEQFDLLPFFALYPTINTGVAFSIFAGINSLILIFLSIAIIVFILFLSFRAVSGLVLFGFSLIVGGASGNLMDRILYGYVIDYFLFYTPVWSFAVFNLADAFITLGAGLIIIHELLDWKTKKPKYSEL